MPPLAERREQEAAEQLQMLGELHDWASRHVQTSDGLLELLPIDPLTYPAQASHHLEGHPTELPVIEIIATKAVPEYPEIKAQADQQEDDTKEFSRIAELLKGGNNVILVTNHGELADIAAALAAVYAKVRTAEFKPKTAIIISQMVAFLKYKIGDEAVAATEALQLLCDDILLSHPRTESAKKTKLGNLLSHLSRKHNDDVNEKLEDMLEEGDRLVALCPSATIDKPISEDDPDTIGMAMVKDGTARILTAANTYVIPIAIWLKDGEVVFKVADIPRKLSAKEIDGKVDYSEVHDTMDRIAEVLSAEVPDKEFVYQRTAPTKIGHVALSESHKQNSQ